MKKIFFSFFALTLLSSFSFADCNCQKFDCDKTCPTEKVERNCDLKQTLPCETKEKCDKCTVDDDEYCVYNECFFDKQYRKMKKMLCLNSTQECRIDALYKAFKSDMENYHNRYKKQKNKVLAMIECGNDCYKEEASELKEIKKEVKERAKCFRQDVKAQLCKEQYSAFRKFQRQQKRKMKKIVKYGAIYKLPCKDCCK